MIIYKATNSTNGKSYIGQTVRSLKQRSYCHKLDSHNGSTTYFHNAIRKYGFDCFSWEVLCICETKQEMDEMEFHYIKQYKTYYYPNKSGYNLTFGGDGNSLFGDRNGMFDKNHTETSIEKMSENRKGLATGTDNGTVTGAGLYLITYPDGHKEEIRNLRGWLRSKDMESSRMEFYNMCSGKRKTPYARFWCERLDYSHQKKVEMGII
jgi:group I intron endonuclease